MLRAGTRLVARARPFFAIGDGRACRASHKTDSVDPATLSRDSERPSFATLLSWRTQRIRRYARTVTFEICHELIHLLSMSVRIAVPERREMLAEHLLFDLNPLAAQRMIASS